MRILVYPHDLNMGGSQTNAIELAAAVTRLGHECLVFGRRGTLCARIEELGLEFIESPDPGRRPSLRIARALRRVAEERVIDVIHGYEWPPGLEAAMATERLPGTAAVCTVMSMAVAPFIPSWMPLVVGTQQISAAEQSAGRTNVTLIEPPVDLQHNGHLDPAVVERFRQDWDLDPLPLVVSVSRLVPELKSEGILTAIRAVQTLDAARPFQLVLVGDGRARTQIEQLAEETNARLGRRAVVLTGELADPRPAYASADVVLGMGGSALRSLAFGKPLVVQGEQGYFRTLTRESVDEFQWQGWYGIGAGSERGLEVLESELGGLLADPGRRHELGAFGRRLVEDFSLDRAALRQLTIYRDAYAARAGQKRQLAAAGRSFARLADYHVKQRADRWLGRQRADDFNARPVATDAKAADGIGMREGDDDGPILYFPGVGWDTLAGTDRQLATALSHTCDVVWVDTPHSVLRRRDRLPPAVSEPLPHLVRLRAPTLAGVQRPLLRRVANHRRAQVARRYLAERGLRPRAVVASTTAPMLALSKDIPGLHVYHATDDFVEAAGLWGVSKRYLKDAREQNLRAADLVLAVTQDLARHLQRGPVVPRWFPNGADLDRFRDLASVPAAAVPLTAPVAGVVGQFNARTDLDHLAAVQAAGVSLLLVGPRWFVSAEEDEAFDRLVALPGVHWVDELPRDQLAPYLRVLDVGLTPYRDSMFNRRSYPLKTVEYLSAGVPVVTTEVASLAGLDPRHVSAAAAPVAFGRLVAEVADSRRDPGQIRAAVEDEGWSSRARRLLELVHQETVRRRSFPLDHVPPQERADRSSAVLAQVSDRG